MRREARPAAVKVIAVRYIEGNGHLEHVWDTLNPICNEVADRDRKPGNMGFALKSGADAPANLPTRARWTPPVGGDAARPGN
jgi:hypothetical protein